MRVDVLENGTLSQYDVTFSGVSQLQFDSESDSTGDRLELTDLWIEMSPENSSTEEWGVLISIWDLTHLRIRCSTITVDGDALK